MGGRDHGTLFRILPFAPAALVLTLVGAAAASSVLVRRGASSCEPETWIDWHVAVKRQCVAPAYVCHNMTPSRLLEDPRVAEAYEDALASNDRGRIREMDVLIGQIRSAYGCDGPPGRMPRPGRPASPPGRLPDGHPPVRGGPDPSLGLDRTI